MSKILSPTLVLFTLLLGITAYVIYKRNIYVWFKGYISYTIKRRLDRYKMIYPRHIIFCFVDHFEPGNLHRERPSTIPLSLEEERDRISRWEEYFPKLAARHIDSDGFHPKHTWFFPPHYDRAGHLERLVGLCKRGLGEIEMHLHHERMTPFPDTSQTLRAKIEKCIEDFSRFGVFTLPDGQKRYGFIHGNWALDNSLDPKFCGINDEINILKETGCFADFTFPTLERSQPAIVNKIYYAKDDPGKPKSYNYGKEVVVGGNPWGDLMIIQGTIGLRWRSRFNRFLPSIEICALDGTNKPVPGRMDYWIENALRVKGRPDWLFVKIHAHGAIEMNLDNLLRDAADGMYSYLEKEYNDKINYFLHYVTAREMYNVIKAAEAGHNGNPNEFRDFEIPKYVYL